MKGYIFARKYFTSTQEMLDFVNNSNYVKQVISVVPQGGNYYMLFYLC